jgi:nucleoid-associated protein YgaU
LILLFASLIAPHKNYSNSLEDSQVIVKGSKLNKVVEADKETNTGASEDLTVENIILEENAAEDLAQNSPLLHSENVTVIDYQIKAGDTLETIAKKFYGSGRYENVQKIKAANKISNARLLRTGQKLIVPM